MYDDNGKQIRTYAEAAEYLGVSKNTVASRLRRANIAALSAVPYDDYTPANVDPEHFHDRENVMLRTLAEEEAGMHISEKRMRELERFKAKSEKLIVVYDPEYGFYWRKREKGEEYWLAQE
ncbi:sigma factor-like helix-turn-helix DNA-binding protein [Streptomyces cadmiisoli]|uniref:sigma factor-like helix-turn-helix DNA-binding protein n=1 Tax=Streptomyces cadmiisoli TaxID=2184053 RepID=UPI0013A6A22A|nr:sigma factor-like helix-turn-helix DNA-binding protein [Streptomyces cadmiisoli]